MHKDHPLETFCYGLAAGGLAALAVFSFLRLWSMCP